MGTLHLAFKAGGARVVPRKVQQQGPSHITPERATHFWFPLHDLKFGWGLLHADVQRRTVRVWGRTPAHLAERAGTWMTSWLKETVWEGEPPGAWSVERVDDAWCPDSDTVAALEMAGHISHSPTLEVTDVQTEWAARLLPEVCREYGRDQDRRQVHSEEAVRAPLPVFGPDPAPKSPLQKMQERIKGGQPPPRPEGTRRHMVWQQIRAEALRQKKRRKTDEEEDGGQEKEWKAKWRLSAAQRGDARETCHVVTVNIGPRGLSICLEELPSLLTQHDTLPMAIHLQDIRISARRFKTIHDRMKQVMPDYTAYAHVKKCKTGRRYQMGVLTLLRNDVAHKAEQIPLAEVTDQEGKATDEALLRACAGRVLVTKTSPPGAPGQVWHINVYQHTSNAAAAERAAVWEVCSRVVKAAEEQGVAVIVSGDLNATTWGGQRGGRTSAADH